MSVQDGIESKGAANADKASDRDSILGRLGPLTKLRPETLDNLRNVVRDRAERSRNPESLYGMTPLPESYKRGDALFHLHLSSVDVGGGSTTNICAIFKYCPRPNPILGQGFIAPSSTGSIASRFRADNLEQPMFVGIVEFVKEIQGITVALAPTSVWLQQLDCCLMFVAKRLNEPLPITLEMGGATPRTVPIASRYPILKEDRELSPCQCFFSCLVEPPQLVDEAIEGATKVVGSLADADSQVQWRKNIYKSAKRIFSGFRVQLGYDNSIVGLRTEASLREAESFDVTFCTPDLEAWAIERMHEVYSHHEQRRSAQTEDPEGPRNPRPQAQGRRRRHRKAGEVQAVLNSAPPEEVAPQTSPEHSGDCSATHTRLGSPEDA